MTSINHCLTGENADQAGVIAGRPFAVTVSGRCSGGAPVGKAFGSPRMAPVLAVVLGLLALGASLTDVPLAIARHQTGPGGPVAYTLVTLAVAVPGTAVGVLLATRRPRNPMAG